MPSFTNITYQGRLIAILDISDTDPETMPPFLEHVHQQIALQPPKSLVVLTDVSNLIFSTASAAAMVSFVVKNSPFIKASAVVGIDGMRAVVYRAAVAASKRLIRICKTRDEALEWLVKQ